MQATGLLTGTSLVLVLGADRSPRQMLIAAALVYGVLILGSTLLQGGARELMRRAGPPHQP